MTFTAQTKADGVKFMEWWLLAIACFENLGMSDPKFGAAHRAYDAGYSPRGWAEVTAERMIEAAQEAVVKKGAANVVMS